MAQNKKSKKLSSKQKSFYRNPAFIGVVALFIAVGVFLTFNTFAATDLSATAAKGNKDQSGCPNDYHLRPQLSYGSAGGCVWTLQIDLIRLGFSAVKFDGQFGPITKNSVIYYQTAHGLTPDGIVGPKTWTRLWLDAEINH